MNPTQKIVKQIGYCSICGYRKRDLNGYRVCKKCRNNLSYSRNPQKIAELKKEIEEWKRQIEYMDGQGLINAHNGLISDEAKLLVYKEWANREKQVRDTIDNAIYLLVNPDTYSSKQAGWFISESELITIKDEIDKLKSQLFGDEK